MIFLENKYKKNYVNNWFKSFTESADIVMYRQYLTLLQLAAGDVAICISQLHCIQVINVNLFSRSKDGFKLTQLD